MPAVVEAEPVQEGLRDVLPPVQLRAAGDGGKQGGVSVLCQDDYPRGQAQMPVKRNEPENALERNSLSLSTSFVYGVHAGVCT